MIARFERRKAANGQIALGVRCHSGWAAYVLLRGPTDEPTILARGRIELCDSTICGSKQPFHHAEPMTLRTAESFIARCSAATDRLASRELAKLVSAYGRPKGCMLLTASGRALPALKDILASHALIHAAEGEFYRDAVERAAAGMKIPSARIRERDLDDVCHALPGRDTRRRDKLVEFGKQVGPPWRQDEKFSALAAWLALAQRPAKANAGKSTATCDASNLPSSSGQSNSGFF